MRPCRAADSLVDGWALLSMIRNGNSSSCSLFGRAKTLLLLLWASFHTLSRPKLLEIRARKRSLGFSGKGVVGQRGEQRAMGKFNWKGMGQFIEQK